MLTEVWNERGWIALIPLAMAALAFWAWVAIGAHRLQISLSSFTNKITFKLGEGCDNVE